MEEIEYGALTLKLPIIVVYPEFAKNSDIRCAGAFTQQANNLINKIPALRKAINSVPTAHILLNKANIASCIKFEKLSALTADDTSIYTYKD